MRVSTCCSSNKNQSRRATIKIKKNCVILLYLLLSSNMRSFIYFEDAPQRCGLPLGGLASLQGFGFKKVQPIIFSFWKYFGENVYWPKVKENSPLTPIKLCPSSTVRSMHFIIISKFSLLPFVSTVMVSRGVYWELFPGITTLVTAFEYETSTPSKRIVKLTFVMVATALKGL